MARAYPVAGPDWSQNLDEAALSTAVVWNFGDSLMNLVSLDLDAPCDAEFGAVCVLPMTFDAIAIDKEARDSLRRSVFLKKYENGIKRRVSFLSRAWIK